MAAIDREELEAKIMSTLQEFAAEETVTREARLEDLDITSLDFIELAQILEDMYDIEILGQERMEETPIRPVTVGEAVDALIERVEQAAGVSHA